MFTCIGTGASVREANASALDEVTSKLVFGPSAEVAGVTLDASIALWAGGLSAVAAAGASTVLAGAAAVVDT